MSNHDGFESAPVTGWRDQRFLPLETGVIPLPQSIAASLDDLLSLQHPEGFWVGELEADISLESDAILLEHFLGTPRPDRVGKLANCIREERRRASLSGRPSPYQSDRQRILRLAGGAEFGSEFFPARALHAEFCRRH